MIELAKSNDWSLARATGFVAGAGFRKRREKPAPSMLVRIDQYGMGFRAGYFKRSDAADVYSPTLSGAYWPT